MFLKRAPPRMSYWEVSRNFWSSYFTEALSFQKIRKISSNSFIMAFLFSKWQAYRLQLSALRVFFFVFFGFFCFCFEIAEVSWDNATMEFGFTERGTNTCSQYKSCSKQVFLENSQENPVNVFEKDPPRMSYWEVSRNFWGSYFTEALRNGCFRNSGSLFS